MELEFEQATGRYADAIKATKVYRCYREQLAKIKEMPDKYRQVNEIRRENYELQKNESGDGLYERIEAFADKMEQLREDPVVDEFLKAELALCRLMQEIMIRLTEAIEFDREFPL